MSQNIDRAGLLHVAQRMDTIDDLLRQLVEGADPEYIALEISRQTGQVRKKLPAIEQHVASPVLEAMKPPARRVDLTGTED